MTNDPTIDQPRFQVRTADNWQFWIHDNDHEERAPQGPFDNRDEAIEHARELNSIRWR